MNEILIIEDDLKLKKYMQEYLNAYDYNTILLNDFENVLEDVQHIEPNLIILDLELYQMASICLINHFAWLQHI
ncbi:hypothetical protein [Clostridium psychrophilum]|uniref:hypothetical protein n=1 Tax=Clostridium psychrophilum TaxID=132926 RepID=UPI001C0DA04D|nr:hypothetical protein [Clostridium psychrophilum]MBU3181489.1 hypothetical protein [Clostridium psychrophilum]